MDPSHIAYHVKVLLANGLIELTEEIPRRGSIEHRFRAVFRELTDEDYAAMTPEERGWYSRAIFCLAAADANCAFSAGSFADRPDHHISRMAIQVDEEGWSELRDLFESTLRQAYEIKREARRPPQLMPVRRHLDPCFQHLLRMPPGARHAAHL